MKRLAVHVLLCLLTFSAGLGIERLLIGTTQPQPAVTPVAPVDPEWPVENVLLRPLPTPLPTPSPTQNLILDYDIKKFDPYGSYTIIGNKPNQFGEFNGFMLDFYETEHGELTGAIYVGISPTESMLDQRPAFGLVTQRRLIWATAPSEEGIVYMFEGEFLRGKVLADAREGTAVLQGTLTKSKKGRKIAESKVKFQIVVDHC